MSEYFQSRFSHWLNPYNKLLPNKIKADSFPIIACSACTWSTYSHYLSYQIGKNVILMKVEYCGHTKTILENPQCNNKIVAAAKCNFSRRRESTIDTSKSLFFPGLKSEYSYN